MSATAKALINWKDIAQAATEQVKVDLGKKKILYEQLVQQRSKLQNNVSEVQAHLQLQDGLIQQHEKKLVLKENLITSQEEDIRLKKEKLAANVKKRNELVDVLEMERKYAGEKKVQVAVLEKKLKKVQRKLFKLKSIGAEELNLTKKNKKLLKKIKALKNSVPRTSSAQTAPTTSVSLQATLSSITKFLADFISSKESTLECPVCYTVSSPPIYKCSNQHIICSSCLPKLANKCPSCRTRSGRLSPTKQVYRQAEDTWKEVEMLRNKMKELVQDECW